MASVVGFELHDVTGEPVEGAMGKGRASRSSGRSRFETSRKNSAQRVTKA